MYESIQAHDRGGACGVIETVTWVSLSCLSEVVNTWFNLWFRVTDNIKFIFFALPLFIPPFLSRRRYRLTSWMLVLMVGPLGTLPGVMLGSFSGSMFCRPFHGTPGQNSGGEKYTPYSPTLLILVTRIENYSLTAISWLTTVQFTQASKLQMSSYSLLPWCMFIFSCKDLRDVTKVYIQIRMMDVAMLKNRVRLKTGWDYLGERGNTYVGWQQMWRGFIKYLFASHSHLGAS